MATWVCLTEQYTGACHTYGNLSVPYRAIHRLLTHLWSLDCAIQSNTQAPDTPMVTWVHLIEQYTGACHTYGNLSVHYRAIHRLLAHIWQLEYALQSNTQALNTPVVTWLWHTEQHTDSWHTYGHLIVPYRATHRLLAHLWSLEYAL